MMNEFEQTDCEQASLKIESLLKEAMNHSEHQQFILLHYLISMAIEETKSIRISKLESKNI